jgi:hypothetical protein
MTKKINRPRKQRVKLPIQDRFWRHVNKTESCWIWTAACRHHGYGAFNDSPEIIAHRMAWHLTYGAVPDGMMVLHKCDVRRCVRPDHLFLGTAKDNTQDCISKGRFPKPNAKLSPETVRLIRSKYLSGLKQFELCKEFSQSNENICRIVNYVRWKDV